MITGNSSAARVQDLDSNLAAQAAPASSAAGVGASVGSSADIIVFPAFRVLTPFVPDHEMADHIIARALEAGRQAARDLDRRIALVRSEIGVDPIQFKLDELHGLEPHRGRIVIERWLDDILDEPPGEAPLRALNSSVENTDDVADSEILTWALKYASWGKPVFPCRPDNKKPYTEHGFKDASIDENVIRGWWTRWPQAMMGMPTGAPSGVFVVDLDIVTLDDGRVEDGRDTFMDMGLSEHDTRAVMTPGGGVHLYFQYDAAIGALLKNTTRKALGPGIDTRGDGGYVILPPSTRADGKRYEWGAESEQRVQPIPQSIIDKLDEYAHRREREADEAQASIIARAIAARRSRRPNGAGRLHPYIAAALKAECDNVARAVKGTRNVVLNEAALKLGHYVGGGELSANEVRDELYAAAVANGSVADKQDGPKAVMATIRSGMRAGMAEPRTVPERPDNVVRPKEFEQPATVQGQQARQPQDEPQPIDGNNAIFDDEGLWSAREKAAEERQGVAGKINYQKDFLAYMPKNQFIFIHSGELWVKGAIQDRFGERAPEWLAEHRPCEQMTWAPGKPAIIGGKLIREGGWIDHSGVTVFNLYQPPLLAPGDPDEAGPWIEHIKRIYPSDCNHLLDWLACRVQRPDVKINHAIVLGGDPGIGKDTILVPVREAVGPWNFRDVSPKQAMGRFNGFLKSIILRISEVRDVDKNFDRFDFYEHTKSMIAAPPEVHTVDEKNIREHPVVNVTGVVLTSNNKTNGLYIPPEDRRHYVAWSTAQKEEFDDAYWSGLYAFLEGVGASHVMAFLLARDLSKFNPKRPPPRTTAFWEIVNSGRTTEESELGNIIDAMGIPDPADESGFAAGVLRPKALIIQQLKNKARDLGMEDFASRLGDVKNRKAVVHRLEKLEYVSFVNDGDQRDGLWTIGGKKQAIFVRKELSINERDMRRKQLQDYISSPRAELLHDFYL